MTEIRRGTAETLPLMLELPETILGRPVPTDWLWWLVNVGYVLDSPLLWAEKHDILLLNVFGGIIPDREGEHLYGVLNFYFCGQELDKDAEPAPERLLDWKKDALRIWGDFRLYAGIDLKTARMHWWEFRAIFDSLPPDSQIMTTMRYRGIDLGTIPDAKERARYARMKRAVALDRVDYEAEYDAAMDRRDMSGRHTIR